MEGSAAALTLQFPEKPVQRDLDSYMTVVSESHHQSTLDAVYVCVVPWSEFPIVPFRPWLLDPRDSLLQSERTQGFTADPVYGRAKCWPMLGEIKA